MNPGFIAARTLRDRPRRGAYSVMLCATTLVAVITFVSLGVDVGRLRLPKPNCNPRRMRRRRGAGTSGNHSAGDRQCGEHCPFQLLRRWWNGVLAGDNRSGIGYGFRVLGHH